MKLRRMMCALIAMAILPVVAARAEPGEPGRCSNDSKLLNNGPTLVYGDDPGTWWGLILGGLAAAFADDQQDDAKIAYLNNVFGTNFDDLDILAAYNQNLVNDNWDLNQNGWICAYELRGTRANLDYPFVNLIFFGISDDKVRK